MSQTRILNGIPRTFLIVIAGSAAALSGTVPGSPGAPRAPLPAHRGYHGRPAGASGPDGHPLRARLAISVIPAGPRPARYTLSAYRARPAYRAMPGHRAMPVSQARARHPARARRHASAAYRPPRQIAWHLLARYHWAGWEFRYLDRLWDAESSWNPQAANPYSGAYGIPQAVPGSKMAAAGPDWRWNARTQIRWGMSYIAGRYGSPYRAWRHEETCGWY